jgi:hypothetical protein
MTERWPKLDYEADRPVIESLHAYLQVMGKLPTRALPWCNHSWHLALRVVPRGFRSYPVFTASGEAEVLFDCLSSKVMVETSGGLVDGFDVTGQSVAHFFGQLSSLLDRADVGTSVAGRPNEVETAIPHRFRRQIESQPLFLGQPGSGRNALLGPRGAPSSGRFSQPARCSDPRSL